MGKHSLSRRQFLHLAAGAGVGTVLAACAPQVVKETVEVTKEVQVVQTQEVEVTKEVPVEKVVTATPAPAVTATLQIWTYPRTENDAELVYKPLVAKFAEYYPTITPEVDVQPWGGRREKLYAAAAAGEPPDIWFATTDTIPAYIEKGVILPVSDLMTPDDLADYSDAELSAASLDGQLYMPLTDEEVNGLAYNGDILTEAGYDPETAKFETWDELFELGEKAKAKGYYLQSLRTFDWAEWITTVHEAGGTVYSADRTKSLMTEQPAIDALTRYVDEYNKGWVPLEGAVGSVEEQSGIPDYWLSLEQATRRAEDAACWRDTGSNPDLNYVVGHARHENESIPLVSGVVSGQGWATTKLSQNKDAAMIWVKFMIKPENIGLYSTLAGTTPVGTQARTFWNPNPCQLEHVNRFSQYLFSDQDANTLWQQSKVICGPHFQAAILGVETVEEALEAIDKELNSTLQEKYG